MRDDTKMIIEMFDHAIRRMEQATVDLERLRDQITDDDFEPAAEAIMVLTQLPTQCKIQTFAQRPMRILENRIHQQSK